MNKRLFLNSIYFYIVFLLISPAIILYGANSAFYLSSQIDLFLQINHAVSALPTFWQNTTALGDALLLFPLLSFLIFKNIRAWAALWGSIPLAVILSHGGKALFSIPRPAAIIDPSQFMIIGDVLKGHNSLPSGHTVTVFAAISAILYIVLHDEQRTKHRLFWSFCLFFIASLVALSRVAVGAHWPFDLLLGAILGVLSGFSGAVLTLNYKAWWRWMALPQFRFVQVGIVFALAYAMIVEYSGIGIAWLSLCVASIVIIKLLLGKNSALYSQYTFYGR